MGSLMSFIIFQKERVINGEMAASTISNYCKPVKLFCEVNDILINWKFLSRGISKGKHASDDRAPTIEEINQLLKYRDIKIKPIVLLMVSSGIRIAAWDFLKWKDIIPIENMDGILIVGFIIIIHSSCIHLANFYCTLIIHFYYDHMVEVLVF